MQHFDVFELTEPPTDQRVLSTGWVHRWKGDTVKSRLVVRGFERLFTGAETCAATPALTTLFLMINYALSTGLSKATGDVSTAFLHASLNELVYVQPPTEIRGTVHAPTGKVLRLKKALYGLRSAPRAWSDHIAQVLTDLGLHRCWTDSCLYWSSTNREY